MIVLGLDISTSIIGWSILKGFNDVVDVGYIDLRNISHESTYELFDKVTYSSDKIKNIISSHQITDIVIESTIGMASGKNINSAILLNRFNYMLIYSLYLSYKEIINIEYVASQSCRKRYMGELYKVWLKLPKTGDAKKEYIVNLVKPFLEDKIEFTRRPRSTNKHLPHLYDISDSFIISNYKFIIQKSIN